ncbi:putative Transcriptional regulator, LysR family protein [Vibrio nigripulchritudo SFn27]|uniref:Putative Transcriptional regulator, LysR family protein n=1 Tax=Vibrio nigripulchritudo TaxID=28173 RepID=U4K457_9VIBR|nr:MULTISPECIES: LysR family transcriptional regulator [Vibrio]UAB73492.1 LysR family transcriptional regulator [Vibrio sp. SCSIO 43132]CCN80646.1 putative Transcriptional regulator, LysR family protein [Vibrio nigripulchritudo BLFn1]CCN90539.1 putative Transcriptional regulator, LysR family protein [Vibrio nigripulchritudo SFn27]CCN93523.1 putative Transcriptional regulator, LysR family protein [Vibrio nigripulchritudo ENn2]CCO41813.1 putative Transcriptional regulator, LysR family protein [V
MFTRDQIVSFCAVYECGSYSAAARRIGRDRSTVREHVTILEDSIGVDLFDIEGRSAVPTNAAKQLYPRGAAISRQIEEFEKAALNSFDQEILVLNIYHDAMIPSSLIAHIERNIRQQYPQTQLNWLHRSRQEAMEDLISGQAHLALMPIKMMVRPDKEVNFINLGRVPLSIYVGANSPLTKRSDVRITDLQIEKQYILENHSDTGLQGAKVSPNSSIVSNNDVVIELLKHNGWAALPDELATPFCQLGHISKIDCFEVASTINYNICVFFSPSLEHNEIIAYALGEIRKYSQSAFV